MTEGTIETNMAEAPIEDAAHEAPGRKPSFALAVAAGLGAAVVGAVGWAVFAYATGYELGLIAVAVGALVGLAVRKAGNGDTANFAILGAACAAFGCLLGIVLSDVAYLAQEAGRPFLFVFEQIGLGGALGLAVDAGDAMQLLFVAIAIWEGFKFSIHPEPPEA